MRAYIIRRLLLVVPTLFILSVLVFLSVRFIPGDVIDIMAGRTLDILGGQDRPRDHRRAAGLAWTCRSTCSTAAGSVAFSCAAPSASRCWAAGGSRSACWDDCRSPPSSALLAILIGLVIALPVGIYSAIRQYTAADYLGRSVAIMGLATPNFWLGTMVMIYPAIWWAWSPPIVLVPLAQDPLGNLGMFLIPSLILGTYLAASTMRMTRTMMLEVLRQDYIRTAWAKGLLERSVILRHAVKNAIIPVVTLVGMQLPILVGGSVIIENIFNLPGLGRLMLDALNERDYPVVSAVNLFFAAVVVVVNLLTDLLYASLDPRIRYE